MNSNNFINIYQTVQMVEPLNNIIHVQNYISDIILYRNVLMYSPLSNVNCETKTM